MKYMSKFLMLVAMVSISMVACKNDDAARDEARASLENTAEEVTPTTQPVVNSNNTNEETVPSGPLTSIAFNNDKYDFGLVDQGEKVNYTYEFTNTGNEPLVLSNVKPSCGCTTPSWTREPIAPGETGSIEVEFDSKGKSGKQNKTVTVTANTNPAKTILTLTGEISKPENTDS